MSFLWVFPVLFVLVLAHELGHFLTAKWAGVKVLEFGIGYPPRIFGLRRGETEYSLNLLPLGGFVRLLGEEDPSDPRSLAARPPSIRLIILAAGAFMNAILPLLLFTAAYTVPHQVVTGQVVVDEVAPDSPAAQAGIQPGAVIVRINDRPVRRHEEALTAIHQNLGRETTFVLRLDRFTQVETRLVPRWAPPEGQGPVGIRIGLQNPVRTTESLPIWEAAPKAFATMGDVLVLFKSEVTGWFAGNSGPQMAGPIGIAQVTGEVAEQGLSPLLNFTALLSINLAFLNILPIPMLDGGRMAFVLLEILRRGRRISPEWESRVHAAGFVLLLALVLFISYEDVFRILRRESLLP